MIAATKSGYHVAAWQLQELDVPIIAVLGLQAADGTRRSLLQDIAQRAKSAIARTSSPDADGALAALIYLAQIGRLRTAEQDGGEHVAWPPIRGGSVVNDLREWRRPYLFQMTRQALNNKVLPRAVKQLLSDREATLDDAIEVFGKGALLRADDPGLRDAVQWYGGALGYPECSDTAAAHEMVREIREQIPSGRWSSWREALSSTVRRLADGNDIDGLGTLFGLLRGGHGVVHTAIRMHQRRALDELGDLGSPWSEVRERSSGLNRLLYEPVALSGNETWQFAMRGRKLRITLPEVIALGRDAIGRENWLIPLIAAYAEGDDQQVQKHLDRLRAYLALFASSPDALMVRPTSGEEEDLWANSEGVDFDITDLPGSSTGGGLEREELYSTLKSILTHPQWEALYLVELAGYSVTEAASQLGISGPAVSQRIAAAKRALSKHPQLAEWLSA